MKKLLSALLVFSMAISLFACGKPTTTVSSTEETNVVKEVDNTKNSNKIKANGYNIGNNIYILGVVDSKNDDVTSFHDGCAAIRNSNTKLWAIINTKGELITDYNIPGYGPSKVMYRSYNDGLLMIDVGKYIDVNGKLAIDYQCSGSDSFSDGYAVVMNSDHKFGFIDKEGKLVIDFLYDEVDDFSDGLAVVKNNNGKRGVIDKNGKILFELDNGSISKFSEGIAYIESQSLETLGIPDEGINILDLLNKFSGYYINNKGERICDENFKQGTSFSEGYAAVKNSDNKWGFIDKNGKIAIDYKYGSTGYSLKGASDGRDDPDNRHSKVFSSGLALVSVDGTNYGYIDKNDNTVIDFKFNSSNTIMNDFIENLSCSSIGEKYGILDKNGDFVIKPIFDGLSDFSEGFALANYNGMILILTYLNPYDLGYTSNQLLNAKNILLKNDANGYFTEYYNSLENNDSNWIINTSNWKENDYKKDLEKTIKEKEIKPDTWYVTEAGIWYYFEDDRTTKKTGWYKDPEDKQMYYLDPETGIMATGWTEIDGNMYYFNEQHGNDPNWFYVAEKDIWASAGKDVKSYGSMFRDEETPDGKKVDAEGKLIE